MKKGRHRRYEEARALKRGPDLDVERLFDDLGGERPAPIIDDEIVSDDEDGDEWDDEDEFAAADDLER